MGFATEIPPGRFSPGIPTGSFIPRPSPHAHSCYRNPECIDQLSLTHPCLHSNLLSCEFIDTDRLAARPVILWQLQSLLKMTMIACPIGKTLAVNSKTITEYRDPVAVVARWKLLRTELCQLFFYISSWLYGVDTGQYVVHQARILPELQGCMRREGISVYIPPKSRPPIFSVFLEAFSFFFKTGCILELGSRSVEK